MVEAEIGERVADLVEAFYADWGDELVIGFKFGQSVTAVELGRREDFWVGFCETADDIELRERHGYSCVWSARLLSKHRLIRSLFETHMNGANADVRNDITYTQHNCCRKSLCHWVGTE